jgi:integrase
MPLLTDRTIAQTKPEAARKEVPDALVPGLYLIVQPSGHKSWAARYRVDRRARKLTLGPYPRLGLAAARDAARKALESVALGKDPILAKMSPAAVVASAEDDVGLFAYQVAQYKALHVPAMRPGSQRYFRRELDAMAMEWSGRALASITKKDVIALLDKAAKRGPGARNTTWTVAKAFFAWVANRAEIETSPAAGIKRPSKDTKRDRVLGDAELAAVWRRADEIGGPGGACVKLLILTGCRRDEIARLEWTEVKTDAIELPAERVKTNVTHRVALTPAMKRVLDALPRRGRFAITGKSRPLTAGHVKEKFASLPIPPWKLHDLRRSFTTGMARIKIAPHVIERCLNHALGGVASIYQHHSYYEEMAEAFARWSDHVTRITA